MKKLNAEVATPLYEQIYQGIMRKIDAGDYQPGDKIPTESELEEQYGVSRVTVRNALSRLVNENLLVKKAGKGTFISMPAFVESTHAESSFTKSCLIRNAVPSTIVVSHGIVSAKQSVLDRLGVRNDSKAICIKRLRLVNSVASIMEIDYFPPEYDFMLYADVVHVPLLEIIREKTGKIGNKNESIIEVKRATSEHARCLECSIGDPLLGVSQTIMTESREILYYNEQFIRSDRYKYVVGT